MGKRKGEGWHQTLRGHPPTPRQLEIWQLLTDGKSNKEIASLLGIAHNTVKNHVYELSQQLDVSGQVELVTFGLRNGYTTLGELKTPRQAYQRGRNDEIAAMAALIEERRKACIKQ